MKARKLRKILNDTAYIINNNSEYIAVGSPICHNLISVDKKTLKLKYALDTFNKGRESIHHDELEFIWDKLQELIDSGEITDIIDGDDVIENPISVFKDQDGKIIEKYADKMGWPNVTHDGHIMYDNVFYYTKIEAIEKGIRKCDANIKWHTDKILELDGEMRKNKDGLERYLNYKNSYEKLLKDVNDEK